MKCLAMLCLFVSRVRPSSRKLTFSEFMNSKRVELHRADLLDRDLVGRCIAICLKIGAGVAKFNRAKLVYSAPNVPPKFSPTLA
jgi:hypothetical protein